MRSFFLPESSKTHCYFEGASQQAVEEVNRRASIPYVKVTEVVELTPDLV